MDKLITRLIQKQNKSLLEALCEKYNLDKEDIMKKYHIPQYYVIGGDGRSYEIHWSESGKPKE